MGYQTPAETKVIPLGNKPYATAQISLGVEYCHNMFLENAQSENSKAEYFLIKIPGLRRFGEIPGTNLGACRCMHRSLLTNRTFAVFGQGVYEILLDGTRSFVGALRSTSGTGPVKMADNGQLLMLVDGDSGWIIRLFDGSIPPAPDQTFTRITDPYFPGVEAGTLAPTFVTFIDTYFVVNNPDTNQYYWSWSYYIYNVDNLDHTYDPAVSGGYWTPLNSGAKIGQADNINALANCNNYLWLLGTNSCEVHYDSGDFNGQLFKRYQGAVLNIGCNAPFSLAVYQNSLYFLGTDTQGTLGVFTNAGGMAPVRISTRGIEQIIEDMADWSDCIAYCYAQNGHAFYVMQFPKASRTLVYDSITNAWHERTKLIQATGLLQRWDGMYAVESAGDMVLIGDAASSAAYQLDQKYYQNDNPMDSGVNYIRCVKTTPLVFALGTKILYSWAQVICNQGSGTPVDTAAGVGKNPSVQLSWAEFGTPPWSDEQSAPIGAQGQTTTRSRVLAGGSGTNRQYRIVMTDPVPFLLVALLVNGRQARWG